MSSIYRGVSHSVWVVSAETECRKIPAIDDNMNKSQAYIIAVNK